MTHFYEPRLGHGLAHDPFGSIVGPRPIGWISSQSADGVLNLAPYSFFNAFNYAPPIIGFASLGYTVEREAYGTGVNVIGVLDGTSAPAEQVVISAHYDSVANCPGADDNGSGVAGVLEAARVLSTSQHKRTLVVACWDEEEKGLIGSSAFVARAAAAVICSTSCSAALDRLNLSASLCSLRYVTSKMAFLFCA